MSTPAAFTPTPADHAARLAASPAAEVAEAIRSAARRLSANAHHDDAHLAAAWDSIVAFPVTSHAVSVSTDPGRMTWTAILAAIDVASEDCGPEVAAITGRSDNAAMARIARR